MQASFPVNCLHHYKLEILNLFDLELHMMKAKPISNNKSKVLLSELKKFKSQSIFVLEYKKRNDGKIFHSSDKLNLLVKIGLLE